MLNDEIENPVTTAEPEVVVDGENSQQEQQQSEQQPEPMAMDECRSENETPGQHPDADFGKYSAGPGCSQPD